MPATQFVRAQAASPVATDPVTRAQTALAAVDLSTIARHMFALILRNVSSDGFQVRRSRVSPAQLLPARMRGRRPVVSRATRPGSTRTTSSTGSATPRSSRSSSLPPRCPPGRRRVQQLDRLRDASPTPASGNAAPTAGHACFTDRRPSRGPGPSRATGRRSRRVAVLAAFAAARRRDARPSRSRSSRRERRLPARRVYQRADDEPLGGAVGLLLLRPLGPAAVLPGDRGQHRRPPRARRGSPDAVAWLEAALGVPLGRPSTHPLAGTPSRQRAARGPRATTRTSTSSAPAVYGAVPVHRHAGCWPPPRQLRQPVGRPGLAGRLPDQRAPTHAPRHRPPARSLPGRPLRRRHRRPRPIGGHPWALCTCELRRAATTGSPPRSTPPARCRSTISRRRSSRRSGSRRARRRPTRPARCAAAGDAMLRRGHLSQRPPRAQRAVRRRRPATRRACATSPGATRRSSPPCGPGPARPSPRRASASVPRQELPTVTAGTLVNAF